MGKTLIPEGYEPKLDLHDTQVAIKTEKAATQLRWLGAEKIERADGAAFKAEKEAYEAAFAAEMQRLLG